MLPPAISYWRLQLQVVTLGYSIANLVTFMHIFISNSVAKSTIFPGEINFVIYTDYAISYLFLCMSFRKIYNSLTAQIGPISAIIKLGCGFTFATLYVSNIMNIQNLWKAVELQLLHRTLDVIYLRQSRLSFSL